jgi:redox-sensing transcriptional repressor
MSRRIQVGDEGGIRRPSLQRLPTYYRRLLEAIEEGNLIVSSAELGSTTGVPAAQVRKDLSFLSETGTPGVGYDVRSLATRLEEYLGLTTDKEAALVGVGNLGRALISYPGFARYGLHILALFDRDPATIGQIINGCPVLPVDQLSTVARHLGVRLGIITVPAGAAQDVAALMVQGGIRAIWNFAPVRLVVPDSVWVQYEDIAARLALLSHHMRRTQMVDADSRRL